MSFSATGRLELSGSADGMRDLRPCIAGGRPYEGTVRDVSLSHRMPRAFCAAERSRLPNPSRSVCGVLIYHDEDLCRKPTVFGY